MSIRNYNKDHLAEHAGVSLAGAEEVNAPESGDPLVFWTKHETEPVEVNLHPFSTGQNQTGNTAGGGNKFIPFTGRPRLILQVAPAIKEAVLYAAKQTVVSYLNALREWWRILDAVEASAEAIGQVMTRVEDVRLLTQVHETFAHKNGMSRQQFGKFRAIVDSVRIAAGGRPTFWESPEEPDTEKQIPPKEQRDAVRFAVREACRSVLERWALYDRLNECSIKPEDSKEFEQWRDVKYMRYIQKTTGKTLPIAKDVPDAIPRWAINVRGNLNLSLRESVFPSHWDAQAVWHQCLLNTGWNSSTLTNLDATKSILINHFKDDPKDPHGRFVLTPQTYELVGEKARAGGKEQFVIGQWKSLDGPGHLIKSYMKRVEPLRAVINKQLELEQEKYAQMDVADYKMRAAQFALVKRLQQGTRSVWLYVNRDGKVGWINEKSYQTCMVNGDMGTYLDEIVHSLNKKRAAIYARQAETQNGPIEPLAPIHHLAPKDFRVWFADYVYRASLGNMLHVKRALNHARIRTSNSYTNTNILNQEAKDSARSFLNILIGELDAGRIDLTILAHLHRYGHVTPEQEELLSLARKLPRSRVKVACKDARHPPPHIKASSDQDCDVQRCLLCQENAVLLPESLDGIAMRTEELRALQAFLPIETWLEDMYDVELKNNLLALRKFDLNKGLAARKKWAQAIIAGEHSVPGIPLDSLPKLMELV